jgi:hypothetical protein
VRDAKGRCIGASWPEVVGIPIQERHLRYEWDGDKVARYFDYKREAWTNLAQASENRSIHAGYLGGVRSSCSASGA